MIGTPKSGGRFAAPNGSKITVKRLAEEHFVLGGITVYYAYDFAPDTEFKRPLAQFTGRFRPIQDASP